MILSYIICFFFSNVKVRMKRDDEQNREKVLFYNTCNTRHRKWVYTKLQPSCGIKTINSPPVTVNSKIQPSSLLWEKPYYYYIIIKIVEKSFVVVVFIFFLNFFLIFFYLFQLYLYCTIVYHNCCYLKKKIIILIKKTFY